MSGAVASEVEAYQIGYFIIFVEFFNIMKASPLKFVLGELYFNRIYVVESLRNDDRKTGTELYNDIIRRRTSPTLSAEILNVGDRDDLFECLQRIKESVQQGVLPFIHLETHGDEGGIQLAGGDDVSWTELFPTFSQINFLTKNNLFISVASCCGGSIQLCVKITEPCPFRGFIGPAEIIGPYDVLTSYTAFFNVLLLTNDFDEAIEALNSSTQNVPYHYMDAAAFFDLVIKRHKDHEKQFPEIGHARVEYLLQTYVRKNSAKVLTRRSRRRLRRSISNFVKVDKPEVLEILRKRFCHVS